MIRCILVDDEPLARERLSALLAESDHDVEIVGEAGGGKHAIELVRDLSPDAVFLDVQMPVLDGFDVVDLMPLPRPHVVFVTAYDEYALQAFDVHAIDYLTKPVRLDRLNRTLERLVDHTHVRQAASRLENLRESRSDEPLRRIIGRRGRRMHVIDLADVQWFEAKDKLVFVHTDGEVMTVDQNLDQLERRLDPRQFIRVHRSSIINASAVRELIPWFAGSYVVDLKNGTRLDVARRRVKQVKERLGG